MFLLDKSFVATQVGNANKYITIKSTRGSRSDSECITGSNQESIKWRVPLRTYNKLLGRCTIKLVRGTIKFARRNEQAATTSAKISKNYDGKSMDGKMSGIQGNKSRGTAYVVMESSHARWFLRNLAPIGLKFPPRSRNIKNIYYILQ